MAYEIIRGYKQGRAVMFYDLLDRLENKTLERVHKDDIVKMCEDGQVSNAKIQWWEGKPIVRCSVKELPVLRLDEAGNTIGHVEPVVRNHGNVPKKPAESKVVLGDVSDKAVVVGKLSTRKTKESIAYGGYDRSNLIDQQEAKSSIKYDKYKTLRDLFRAMATEYGLRNIEEYEAQIEKKVDLSKTVNTTFKGNLLSIQNSFNTYLMNMANRETNETFLKYRIA